jgi:surface protein
MLRWKSSLKPAASGDDNPGTTNLVNDWSMDETSGTRADSHGSADLTDNNTVTSATGVISNAASFNPANSEYLSSSTQPVTGTVARATECWFKTSYSGTDGQCITDYGAGSTGARWRIGIDNGGLVALRVFGATKIWDSSWNDGNWHHLVMQVAASSDCDDVEVYVDGTLDTSASGASATVSIDTGTGSQRIGLRSNATNGFNGQIDEFRNWNRVLTSAEITWLYNSGSGRAYSDVSAGGITLETEATTTATSFATPTDIDVNIPAVSIDDILLLLCTTTNVSQPTDSPPSGWTKIREQDNSSASGATVAAYWKRSSVSAVATTESWSAFYPSGESYYIWVGSYSGCTTSGSPIDTSDGNEVGFSSSVATSFTTNVTNTMVVSMAGTYNQTVTWSPSAEIVETNYNGSNWASVNGSIESTAGSKTVTATLSGNARSSIVTVALRDTASTNNNFDFTVTTTTSSETFTIPCQNSGTFDATVDWGDGSTSAITAYNDADLAHIYATAGDHDISISGTFPNIYFNNGGDKDKVKSVTNLGSVGWTSFQRSFRGCSNMTSFDAGDCDTSSATSAREMFYNCTSLTSVDVSSFDTSSVTTMQYIFGFCSSITSLDLSNFDTSSVTLFANAFRSCTSLTSVDVSSFDTSSATNMISMFSSCSSLTTVTGIEDFDITGLAANQMTNFLNSSTLSTAVYDELLVNWEGQTGYNNQNPHFGSSTYTAGSAAATARAALVTAGWSITDGGTA